MARDPTNAETWLLSLPPTSRQTRWVVTIAVCQLAALALLAPFATIWVGPITGFIPAFEGVVFVTDLVTSVLLFSQFAAHRLSALLVLACGYLLSALMIIPHALTFPGAFSPTGLLGAGPRTTAWLYWFWHFPFAVALLGYALMRDDKSKPNPARRSSFAVIVPSVALVLALVCGLALLATAGSDRLPPLFVTGVGGTLTNDLISATAVLVCVSALAVLSLRRRSVLDQWLMIVALAAILEIGIAVWLAPQRFNLAFYAGRLFSLLTSTIVMAVLMVETMRLYANVARFNESKIRRLVDSNIIGILIGNLEGHVEEANQAFLQIVGYEQADVAAGRLRRTELTPAEWHDRDAQAVAEMTATGSVQPFEKEYFRKDGSRVPVLVGGATFGERKSGVIVFIVDLTERKRAEQRVVERTKELIAANEELKKEVAERRRAEEALDLRELQLRLLVDSIAAPVALMTVTGEVDVVNAAVLEYFGKTLEELKRWSTIDAVHPDDLAGTIAAWQRAIESGQPYEVESRHRRADGIYRWFHVRGFPIRDVDGSIVRWCVLQTDIEDRKKAEQAARENELRYRDVQTELAHANRVATMGQLSASIAHEVSQPIAATLTSAEAAVRWLTGQPPNLERAQQAVDRIINDGMRAADIVSRIRNFSKKAPVRKEDLEINEAILEIIGLTRSEMSKNGIVAKMQLAQGLPPILGDRVQLQQVILNLIMNAIEAMNNLGEGSRELSISTNEAASDTVLVALGDSGPGLPEAAAERIFEAFYTTKPGGLGMGLSICRSIIEAHGGRLWAEPNEPRGAVFYLRLPIRG